MTDEHEHAMKVAKVIAKAMGDNFSDAFKNKQRWTAKRGMSGGRFRDVNEPFQDDYIAAAEAAAAVIAADRAGLVARIAELEGALFDATAMIGHNLTMKATALVAGKTLNAYDVWKAGSAALKGTRHDEQ